jgi:hypothetical protein
MVDIDDDDLLRAKRKADRAGLDVPKPKQPQRAASASSDSDIYPGRELIPFDEENELTSSSACWL